jgi:hypothetical protein
LVAGVKDAATGLPFESLERLDSMLSGVARGAGVLRVLMGEGLEALGRAGGCAELGFATVEAHALERCGRSARWVQESRALGRRLEELPALRRAVVSGEVSFSMAQVVAKVARSDDEEWWLAAARGRTVRAMRELVKERARSVNEVPAGSELSVGSDDSAGSEVSVGSNGSAGSEVSVGSDGPAVRKVSSVGGCSAEVDEARGTLAVTVDREDAWLFECARMMGRRLGEATLEGTLEALLAEGTTSLLEKVEPGSIESVESVDDGDAQRAWEKELSRFREEAEVCCEARMVRPGHVEPDAFDVNWDGDAEHVDSELRRIAAELAGRDLLLGELAEAFWSADGWRRLGYATESQYARERLGMGPSSVKAKRALARRARSVPRLGDAMNARALGFEAARLVAVIASPETAGAWLERARERTVKHLREEVEAAQMLGRLRIDPAMRPPDEATMEEIAAIERRVATGSVFRSERSQMSAGEGRVAAGPELGQRSRRGPERSRGRVTLKFRVRAGTQRYYRWLEAVFRRSGPRGVSFFQYLCLAFIAQWTGEANAGEAYARVYERDGYRCTSPVCTRRDVTPHHLLFRSAGGDDSDENVASLCTWCHLEGVHGGRLSVAPPASAMEWRIGRRPHTVVRGRKRTAAQA